MTLEEQIAEAWYQILNGNVTVGSYTFPVYRDDAEIRTDSHFIMLREESGADILNKSAFLGTFVLIVEIVTKFGVIINAKLVNEADEIIRGLAMNSPSSNNLNVAGVVQLYRGSYTYLPGDDGAKRIYRKITRFVHQVASETA